MAKFIIGNSQTDKAVQYPAIRNTLWAIDLVAMSALMVLFRAMPLKWASGLGARLGVLGGRIFKARNRHVLANLTMVMPEASREEIERTAGQVWANAGAVLAEFPNLHKIGQPRREAMQIEIMERIPAYDQPDTPAVFVSPHMANWEVAALSMTKLGLRTCAMYAPLANPWLDRKVLQYRRVLGCDLVSREAGVRAFLDALKSGICPIMITDRKIEGGTPMPFFGEEKTTSMLPARLALRYGVPLVPVQVERLPGPRFRIRYHPPLHPQDPEAPIDARIEDLTRQINAKFEEFISARPGDWLCTSKIWSASVLRRRTDIYNDM